MCGIRQRGVIPILYLQSIYLEIILRLRASDYMVARSHIKVKACPFRYCSLRS